MNTCCVGTTLTFCMAPMLPASLSANTVIFGGYIDTVSVNGDPTHKVPQCHANLGWA